MSICICDCIGESEQYRHKRSSRRKEGKGAAKEGRWYPNDETSVAKFRGPLKVSGSTIIIDNGDVMWANAQTLGRGYHGRLSTPLITLQLLENEYGEGGTR